MLLRHLHDQDAVLGGQADQGHQTHLGVDVEINRANREEGQGTQHRQGHGHQDDHRRHVALVLGREHQVDDQNAEGEHQHTGAARRELQGGDAGEGVADVVEIEAVEDLLNRRQGLARTGADRLSPLHQDGAVEVVVADHRRRAAELAAGELRHLHQFVVAVAHVVAQHILKVAAAIGLGLHIDVAHLTALVGEAGVIAARQHGDGLHRLLEIHVEGAQD